MKLIAALILTIAVGVQVLEASGRWDGGFADANDEAGLVGVVLCVGIAVAAAAARLTRARPARISITSVVIRSSSGPLSAVTPAPTRSRGSSPPTTLRI